MRSAFRNLCRPLLPATAALCFLGVSCRDKEAQSRAKVLETGRAFTIAEFIRAAGEGQGAVVERFLAAGMRVDAVGPDGITALRSAAEAPHAHIVNQLLAAGASPDLPDVLGVTPLMAAARAGDENGVSALQAAGADPDRTDADGMTALSQAAAAGQAAMTELLSRTPGQDLEPVIQVACAAGHTGVIDCLLRASGDPDGENGKRDWSLLLRSAAANGRTDALRLLGGRIPQNRDSATICREAASVAGPAGHVEAERLLLETAAALASLKPEEGGRLVSSSRVAPEPVPSGARAVPASLETAGTEISSGLQDGDSMTGGPEEAETETPIPPVQPAARLGGSRFPQLECEAMADVPGVLRMTAWEPRAWPVVLEDVAPGHETATIQLTGETTRTVTLRVGDEIPGTGCVIEKLRRRRLYADAKQTILKNVSELHFRRAATGETFKASPGEPVLSNDSTALLELSGSSRPWTTVPGDEFRLGSLLLRSKEVTESGLLLENRLTRETVEVPMGARSGSKP